MAVVNASGGKWQHLLNDRERSEQQAYEIFLVFVSVICNVFLAYTRILRKIDVHLQLS